MVACGLGSTARVDTLTSLVLGLGGTATIEDSALSLDVLPIQEPAGSFIVHYSLRKRTTGWTVISEGMSD